MWAAKSAARLKRQLCPGPPPRLTPAEDAGTLDALAVREICDLTRRCFPRMAPDEGGGEAAARDAELWMLLFRPFEPEGGQCLVVRCYGSAADDAPLVGVVLGAVHRGLEKCTQLTIFNLCVDSSCRGRGLATILLTRLISAGIGKGAELVIGNVLMTDPSSSPLLKMYAHLGAEVVDTAAFGTSAPTQQRLRGDISGWTEADLERIRSRGGEAAVRQLALVGLAALGLVLSAVMPRPHLLQWFSPGAG